MVVEPVEGLNSVCILVMRADIPISEHPIAQDASLIVRPFRCGVQLSEGGNTLSYIGRGCVYAILKWTALNCPTEE